MNLPCWNIRLRIISETLTVPEIERLVGGRPDRASERGTLPHGSSLPRRFSTWEVTSLLDPTADAGEHVSGILDRVSDLAEGFLRAVDSGCLLEMSIVARFDPSTDRNPNCNLSAEQLRFLAKIRAEVDLEIIAAGT